MERTEERVLAARAKKGDMEAFEALVRQHQRGIYALCFRMTGMPQTADDLAQETFVRAFTALDRFDPELPFFPWLRRIAVNASLNHLKAYKREEPLGNQDGRVPSSAFSSSSPSPHDELQRKEAGERLERALKALPAKLRSVFVLHVFDEMTYEDIAGTLCLPRGTVMSRLNRARRRLKAALGSGPSGGER